MKKILLILMFNCIYLFAMGQIQTHEKFVKGAGEANGGTYKYEALVKYQIYNMGMGEIVLKLGIVDYKLTGFYYKGVEARYDHNYDFSFPIVIKNHQANTEGSVTMYPNGYGITYPFKLVWVRQGFLDNYFFPKEDKDDMVMRLNLKEDPNNLKEVNWSMEIDLFNEYFEELAVIAATIDDKILENKRQENSSNNSANNSSGSSASGGSSGSSKKKLDKKKEDEEKEETESDSTSTTQYYREPTHEEVVESYDNTMRELNAFEEDQEESRAEQNRRARVREYENNVAQQTEANIETAAEMGAGVLQIAIMVGAIMYQNLGKTHQLNVFKGDAPRLNFNVGYTATSAPIASEVTKESFDGYNYTYTTEATDYQTGTLDIEFGMSVYPIYGEKYGFGAFSKLMLGTGLMIQNSRLEYNYGVKGFYGTRRLQFFAEAAKGRRGFNYHPWVSANESGGGGVTQHYLQTKLGLRCTFNMRLKGPSRGHLEFAPIFEFANAKFGNINFLPLQRNASKGFYLGLDVEHRLKFFTNFYPNFNRIRTSGSNSSADNNFYLNLGVIRNYDVFGKGGAYARRSTSDVDDARGWAVEFVSPGVTWFSNRTDTLRTSNFDFNLNIIKFTKDFSLTSSIKLFTGVGASYNFGSQYTFSNEVKNIETFGRLFQAGNSIKISGARVTVPLGVRLMLGSKYAIKKTWVKAGVNNHFNVYNQVSQHLGEKYRPIENASDYIKPRTMSMMFGAGIDVPVGEQNSIVRVGITYDKGMSNITTDIFDTRLESLNLSLGVVF